MTPVSDAHIAEKFVALSEQIGLTSLSPNIDYRGRTVLITGGADGIGRDNVKGYHLYGANVIAIDVNGEKLQSLADELGNRRITTIRFDLRNTMAGAYDQLLKKINTASGGCLDVYHINAGVISAKPLNIKTIAEAPDEEMDALYQINFRSHVVIYKRILPLLKRSPSGRILLTSSPIVSRIDPASFNYAWTKGALEIAFRTVANELTSLGAENVTVVGYVPPPVQNWLRANWKNEPLYANPMPEDVCEVALRLGSADISEDLKNRLIAMVDKRKKGIIPADGGEPYDANDRTEHGFDLGLRIRNMAQGGGVDGDPYLENYDTWNSRQLVGVGPVPPLDEAVRLRSVTEPPKWVAKTMTPHNG